MQDVREELSSKMKELPEEEWVATLEQIADGMRARRRSLISSLRV